MSPSRWKLLTFALFIVYVALLIPFYDESIDVYGIDVPGWLLGLAFFLLGVFMTYSQFRSESRISPKEPRS